MKKSSQQLATAPASAATAPDLRVDAPPREIQELWFTLAKRRWRSLVLVPAGERGSTAIVARQLANVPRWLREDPVVLLTMSDPLDYVLTNEIIVAPTGPAAQEAVAKARTERVIVSVQPVVIQPLGLAVTQASDLVVLSIEMGRTRMASVRRTIELIGREKIGGCYIAR